MMIRGMNGLLLGALAAAVLAGPAWSQDSRKDSTPESLKAEIEALKPAQLAWREVAWKTCLLEALKEARERKKPVLLWVVGPGEGLDGRC